MRNHHPKVRNPNLQAERTKQLTHPWGPAPRRAALCLEPQPKSNLKEALEPLRPPDRDIRSDKDKRPIPLHRTTGQQECTNDPNTHQLTPKIGGTTKNHPLSPTLKAQNGIPRHRQPPKFAPITQGAPKSQSRSIQLQSRPSHTHLGIHRKPSPRIRLRQPGSDTRRREAIRRFVAMPRNRDTATVPEPILPTCSGESRITAYIVRQIPHLGQSQLLALVETSRPREREHQQRSRPSSAQRSD